MYIERRGIGGLLAVALVCLLDAACRKPEGSTRGLQPPRLAAVACLGRIEPDSRVHRLSATHSLPGPPVVGALEVDVGDRVAAGQVVATLSSLGVQQAAHRQAAARVEVARNRLEVVRSGAKQGAIAARRAEVLRFEAEVENAEAEYERRQDLAAVGALSESELEIFGLQLARQRAMLDTARELLNAVSEVRQVDVALAAAELHEAVAAAERAEADFEQTIIRSPVAGEVLAVHARPGEAVGADGIVEVADLSRMIVLAEVYATDVGAVAVGQVAEISAEYLPEPMQGTVRRVGSAIQRNKVLASNPASFSDRRVVEVEIAVADGSHLAGFIHGQVQVVIRK